MADPARLSDADEAVEQAAAQLLIEIGFLVPKGTDLRKEVGPQLLAYKVAIEGRLRQRGTETPLRTIRLTAVRGRSFGHQATPQTAEKMIERKDTALQNIIALCADHGETGSILRAECGTETCGECGHDDKGSHRCEAGIDRPYDDAPPFGCNRFERRPEGT